MPDQPLCTTDELQDPSATGTSILLPNLEIKPQHAENPGGVDSGLSLDLSQVCTPAGGSTDSQIANPKDSGGIAPRPGVDPFKDLLFSATGGPPPPVFTNTSEVCGRGAPRPGSEMSDFKECGRIAATQHSSRPSLLSSGVPIPKLCKA